MSGKKDLNVNLYIVVADDDPDDHELVKSAIRECHLNHIVTSVYNGHQLMDLLLRRDFYKTEYDRLPDLILLDLNMPMMNGFEVLEEMKKDESLRNIPVYVLTGNVNGEDAKKAEKMGIMGFFNKPLDFEDLKVLVGQICSNAIPQLPGKKAGR